MSQALLGATEEDALRNLDMIIDLMIMVSENRGLDDPENNPYSVDLYKRLFGDD